MDEPRGAPARRVPVAKSSKKQQTTTGGLAANTDTTARLRNVSSSPGAARAAARVETRHDERAERRGIAAGADEFDGAGIDPKRGAGTIL